MVAAEGVRQRGSGKFGCAVHCIRVVRCVEKADQKKQKHKSGENSSNDQREIAFLFHNENPFVCRGRLPATFRSQGADDRKLPSVFYADARINSAIQQIYHEVDDNNEGSD